MADTALLLIQLREAAGLSQEELATALDTYQSVVSEHERGIRGVGRKWAERYAEHYGVSVGFILGLEGEGMPEDKRKRDGRGVGVNVKLPTELFLRLWDESQEKEEPFDQYLERLLRKCLENGEAA